jgi:transposase InsO family protein
VHVDLCGPVTPATPGGRRYFLLLIDDLSRYMWVVVLGSKGEVTDAIRRAQVAAEAECGNKLRVLRTDNDGEFASYCADEGVQRHYSASYSQQQNVVVERRNLMVVGMARALLKQRGMPAVFWGEAVVMTVYILNRSSTKALNGRTSYEAWYGRKPAVSHLRVFSWPHRQAQWQEHFRGVHRLRGGLEGLPHSVPKDTACAHDVRHSVRRRARMDMGQSGGRRLDSDIRQLHR